MEIHQDCITSYNWNICIKDHNDFSKHKNLSKWVNHVLVIETFSKEFQIDISHFNKFTFVPMLQQGKSYSTPLPL